MKSAILIHEEQRMFSLFEMTPDLVCIVSKDGYFQKINPAVSKKLQYTEQELKASPVSAFIHPEDREYTSRERAKLLQDKPLLNFQNRYRTKRGETVWLEWTSIYLADKEIVFAIAKDITVHKLKEAELRENYSRFKQLTTHFKNNIEKDRYQMANDLHENLAQLATVIKMEAEWLASQLQDLPPQLVNRGQTLVQTTNLLVNNIRKLAYDIGHGNIADLGLEEALKELCKEFAALTGIRCEYGGEFCEEELSYEVRLDIYRICQEALLNIMQHAEATAVTISATCDEGRLRIAIIDNGKGLDQKNLIYGAGLTTMYGRALSINGQLFINSSGTGTAVELAISSGFN